MRIQKRGPLGDEIEKLAREPELDWLTARFASTCLQAWNDLGADRQLGFGCIGCIPHEAIMVWAARKGMDREDSEDLAGVIRRLDAQRVEREASKRRLKDA
jgi:hypothetical protein